MCHHTAMMLCVYAGKYAWDSDLEFQFGVFMALEVVFFVSSECRGIRQLPDKLQRPSQQFYDALLTPALHLIGPSFANENMRCRTEDLITNRDVLLSLPAPDRPTASGTEPYTLFHLGARNMCIWVWCMQMWPSQANAVDKLFWSWGLC